MEESSFHVLSCTVGCNLFKRLAINALLAIASLSTKEKVLQRVLFATMDDVLKEVNEVRSNWYFARTVHDTLALCMDRCTYLMYGWIFCLSSWSFNTHPINFFYFLILVYHWISYLSRPISALFYLLCYCFLFPQMFHSPCTSFVDHVLYYLAMNRSSQVFLYLWEAEQGALSPMMIISHGYKIDWKIFHLFQQTYEIEIKF